MNHQSNGKQKPLIENEDDAWAAYRRLRYLKNKIPQHLSQELLEQAEYERELIKESSGDMLSR